MSGDVQPRKRKDKKKKKDDLGIEEPRGTAAVFGEGDVLMHSYHEHGTGGHWCAKIIFFSLLAVLITLIGLIILENRGLTELEANQVESRYSGVLEGWLEDAPDDDHHDEHTLELKHHGDEDDNGNEFEHDDDEDHHDDDDEDHHDDDDEDHHDDDDEDHHDDDDEDHHDDDDEDHRDDEDEEDHHDEEEDEHNDDEDEDHDDDDDDNEDEDAQQVDEADEDEDQENYDQSNDVIHNEDDDEQEHDDDDEQEHDDDEGQEEGDDDEEDNDNDDEQGNENNEKLYHEDSAEDNDDDDNEDDNLNLKSRENEDDEEPIVKRYRRDVYSDNNDDDDVDDDDDEEENALNNDDKDERDEADEDEEEHEEPEEDTSVEVEHIEKEVIDDDILSNEVPSKAYDDDDDSQEVSKEAAPVDVDEDDDVEFLEPDELDELPEVLPIPVPKGKPLAEVEESKSTEKPHDTLAEEEEYEKQQEALRKEKEQSSQGLWLKLTVGGALLVATHAVLRRATASRDSESEETDRSREETPTDRRMTLIPEPPSPTPVAPKLPQVTRPIEKEVLKQEQVVAKPPPQKEELEEEEEDEEVVIIKPSQTVKDMIDKERYSDEEEFEEEEEENVVEEEIPPPKPAPVLRQPIPPPTPAKPPSPAAAKEPSPEPEEDDDVEIIDDEQIEEFEEEEDDISEVDDAELLNRLEAKYGRLPEPERPGRKDGGNSIEDMWPGEPSDPYWRDQLDQAEQELRQGEWSSAEKRASAPELQTSARARYILARALDSAAEAKRDNRLLSRAIAAYLDLLKMNERLSDKKLLEVTNRTLERIKFRGTYLSAEPVYKLLIRRFPNDVHYRNNLTVSFLMANRADLAENALKETLKLWPDDKVALAHYGFVLKTLHNKLEEAVDVFTKALEGDTGPACEPRFYYHLGDALLLLGRFAEAHEVHKRGAANGHFLSPSQRSLYNVDRLKSKPWWNVADTPYFKLAKALEKSWKEILKEGEAAKKLYEKEKEGLKERGEWSQLDLFVRGREVPNRCSRAPVTCNIVRGEIAASGCRRGQIKFSAMEAGTHVRPHVGPTNCRLRMHLGLSNTKDTYIRVDQETRQWQTGKVLMFDDSFEHEVWHNGTGTRLVLIVDVWHPDLTPAERRQLPAI